MKMFEFRLKVVPNGPVDNNIVLFQIIAWHQTRANPLSEPMMVQVGDAYMRHTAPMS